MSTPEAETAWWRELRELGEAMTASADSIEAAQGEGVVWAADFLSERYAAGARCLDVLDPDGDPQLCTSDGPGAFIANYYGINQTTRRATMATWPPGLRARKRLA